MRWVDDDEDLGSVLEALDAGSSYFIDTEFESTKRQTTLSLIQISVGSEIFLLDALRLRRLPTLGALLTRSAAEWVLHAGLQDIELLLAAFEQPKPPRLFDTQIAWAMAGPEANVSLAYLKYRILGQRSMKTHQADDWMRRPIPAAQRAYAAADIEDLPAIHRHLCESLGALGRRALVDEISREMLWPAAEPPVDLSLGSFRNAWQLEPRNQAALQFIIHWYNRLSHRDRNRCPPPKTLLAIASRLPTSAKDLKRLKGVPGQFSDQLAHTLVRGMSDAVKAADSGAHLELEPAAYGSFEELSLDAWLAALRAEVCKKLKIAPEIAFPLRLLRSLKPALLEQKSPQALLAALTGWREELLGAAVRDFVDSHPLN